MKRMSLRLRKDPSQTASLRIRYAKDLVYLLKNFNKNVPNILNRRALAAEPITNIAPSIVYTINGVIMNQVNEPARQITAKYSKEAYLRGQLFADTVLKTDAKMNYLGNQKAIEILQIRQQAAFVGITDDMSKKIVNTITDGLLKGVNPNIIAKDITASVDISIARAKTIARTETMYAYNQAAIDRFKSQNIDEVQWLAAMKDTTCEECADLDGQIFPMGSQPECPLHPNCLCVIQPVIPEGV